MPKTKEAKINYDIYDLKGEKIGEGEVINILKDISDYQALLAQTVRVFLGNNRQGTASTKTRGEVSGSTRKIYRQKGTGRARHGDIKAPIFIGGGKVFGPKPREFNLKLNKQMKKKAFLVSLFDKLNNKNLIALSDLSKIEPKTKNFFRMIKKIFGDNFNKEKLLFINSGSSNILLSCRNIPYVKPVSVNNVNTYNVLASSKIIIDQDVINKLFQKIGLTIKTEKKVKK